MNKNQPIQEVDRGYKIRKSIINRIDANTILMLSLYFKPQEFQKALRLFESISIRQKITNSKPWNTGRGAEVAEKIYNKEIKTAAQLLNFVKDSIPNDQKFKTAVEKMTVGQSNALFARYFLMKLEITKRGTKEEVLSNVMTSQVNLEHIHPQSKSGISRKNYTRLGNLTLMLTYRNSKIGAKDFSLRKPVYARSDFQITSMLKNYKEWGVNEIISRQQMLAKLAVKTWPISVL